MSLLEAALAYADAGRRVHPVHPQTKRPLTRWSQSATTEPDRVRALWETFPTASIGMCTGDGIVVIDVDIDSPEPDSSLAQTRTARTRKGWHHIYSSADPIRCSVGVIAEHIDVRGENGYVVAPPSPGYSWHNDAAIQPLPPELLWAIRQHSSTPSQPGRRFEFQTHVGEGQRNSYIAAMAGSAIRNGYDDLDELLPLVAEHNAEVCDPPLPDDEVKRTCVSVLRTHRGRQS